MEYTLKRTCADCEQVDLFLVSKLDAAFERYDSKAIWEQRCSSCGSRRPYSLEHHHPKLDWEIFDLWGNDLELSLTPQDEAIWLAEIEYIPMILRAIDEEKYLERKIDVLVEALCVMLYDQTYPSEEFSLVENEKRELEASILRPELIKRKHRIYQADNLIMDYIKEVVYPQIGLEVG